MFDQDLLREGMNTVGKHGRLDAPWISVLAAPNVYSPGKNFTGSRIANDIQRLKNGYTGIHQRSKGSGKPGYRCP